MKKYLVLTVLTVVVLSLFAIISRARSNTGELSIGNNMRVSVHTSYAKVPVEEQIEKADVIVAGKVIDISQTQWNQDSGEYWEELSVYDGVEQPRVAIAYYTISVAVEQPLIADNSLGRIVDVTVVGTSPLDQKDAELSIGVGNEVVILASEAKLAWRNGERTVLKFLSAPEASLYQQGEDGLYYIGTNQEGVTIEELFARIAANRPNDIQSK